MTMLVTFSHPYWPFVFPFRNFYLKSFDNFRNHVLCTVIELWIFFIMIQVFHQVYMLGIFLPICGFLFILLNMTWLIKVIHFYEVLFINFFLFIINAFVSSLRHLGLSWGFWGIILLSTRNFMVLALLKVGGFFLVWCKIGIRVFLYEYLCYSTFCW